MPRKPRIEKKSIIVTVNEKPVKVTMHLPKGRKTSWYAYWNGLKTTKSTGQSDFNAAVRAVTDMLNNGGERSRLEDAVMSDEEFNEIQRRHYGKKQEPAAKERSEQSLAACMEAITAFRAITGLKPITLATRTHRGENVCEAWIMIRSY